MLATVDANPFTPHTPSPQQALFLGLPQAEALYGGAAGGGKTDALLMACLQFVEIPGYSALYLMRSYADLEKPKAPIPRSHEWLDGLAKWHAGQRYWEFPSGARLDFGYMERDDDRFKYRTAEYQTVVWDEVTAFTRIQYTYLNSRLRRLEGVSIPLRMRAGGNPEGRGFTWVRSRFILPTGERRFPFVPALLDDNVHIDQESYRESLNRLDPITRRRLLDGDWTIIPTGRMFKRHWFEVVRARPEPVDAQVRAWDMASTEERGDNDPDYTAGGRLAVKDGVYYLDRVRRERESPGACRDLVRQEAARDGRNCPIVMEQEPGSSGKTVIDDYARTTLKGYAFKGVPASGSKTQRATPLSIAAEQGLIKLVDGPWVEDFLDEAVVFGTQDAVHDDMVDMAAHGFNELRRIADFSIEMI